MSETNKKKSATVFSKPIEVKIDQFKRLCI